MLLSYKHLPQKEGEIRHVEKEDGTITGILYFLVSLYREHAGAGRMQASQFEIYLNAEGSEFQIQLDLFSLWILSPAVITPLLDSKGEKEIHSTSNRACLASSVNESENQALTFT